MANCLYYKNNPIGIVQSNADDVLYGGGLSVKDKIDSIDSRIDNLNASNIPFDSNTSILNKVNIIDNRTKFRTIGNTTATDHSNIDSLGNDIVKSWIRWDYDCPLSGWGIIISTEINETVSMQVLITCQDDSNTVRGIASRYKNTTWGAWKGVTFS